jgi:hypothetical protein
MIASKLTIAELEAERGRRRALYELAARVVGSSGAVPVFPCLPRNVVPYGFPVFASSAQASGIAAHLAWHGLPLSRWPDLPAAVAPSAPDYYRNLLVVPFLW